MRVEQRQAGSAWADEIEQAIDNVKRTKLDKRMREEWHKAAARDRWTGRRKAKWMAWKRRRSRAVLRGAGHQPGHGSATPSKVWVKGHVPREFLDWVERHWSHDDGTRAVLCECCFEVWKRGGWPKGSNRP